MNWPPPLAVVSGVIGALIMLVRLPGLIAPANFRQHILKFPRSVGWGRALMLVVALLAGWNMYQAATDNWAWARPLIIIGLPIAYWLIIQYADQFLAIRGAAAMALFFAKVMVSAADRSDHPLRLVVTVLAYIWVCGGIWMAIAPHHGRDLSRYLTATDGRCRLVCGCGVLLGAVLILLGVFVY